MTVIRRPDAKAQEGVVSVIPAKTLTWESLAQMPPLVIITGVLIFLGWEAKNGSAAK